MRIDRCSIHTNENTVNTISQREESNIFGIGHVRSGTRSVAKAVQLLGISTIHTFGCERCKNDFVDKYLEGSCDTIVYKRVRFVQNISILHWRLLLREKPNAKFILCVRPVDEWLARNKRNSWRLNGWRTGKNIFQRLYHNHLFGMVAFDWDIWKEAYLSHTDIVKNSIDKSKLLVLNIFEEKPEDLWGRLSEFLSCEKPTMDFPKLGSGDRIIPSDYNDNIKRKQNA